MKKIRVGGVPEHFNFPWHLCIEQGDFEQENINLEWKDFPDGTGAMNKALRSGEIDVAIILSEGVIKDIAAGNPSKIVQVYVESPLIWGIHVAHDSSFNTIGDLQNAKAAISREGSGSQLMAFVNARNQGWDPEELTFEIVGNIDGAVPALKSNSAQYFMWESFTTKPLVDNKIFRKVGDCPTPWPCFLIAGREEFLEQNTEEVKKMLKVINNRTGRFKEIPEIKEKLARRYSQKPEDIEAWLKITSWSQHQLSEEELEKVQDTLLELNLISEKLPAPNYFYSPVSPV